jgi:methyl-branched lipid omega-hydroxylase
VTTTQGTAVEWPVWEDAAFYNQDPEVIYASIATQRRAAPVFWYQPAGYPTGFWVLSKYEHQRFVGSHPELFSSKYGFAIGDASDPETVMQQLPEWARAKIRSGHLSAAETRRTIAHGKLSMGDPNFESLMISDPPRHGQIRNIMMKSLRPSLVRAQKPRIAEITDEFLDQLRPGQAVDFVSTVGQIPAALMTELIGVPPDMRQRFIEMSSAQMLAITINPNMDPAEADRIRGLVGEFHDYCAELVAERKATGAEGDDLVSCIARSEHDGGPVPLGMAISFIHTFVNAGETTRSLLSFIMLLLAQHPDQRHLLAERPELVPNAVEETLRFNPLNWSGCRTAIEDIELGGQLIRKDDYVVMAYSSANRDEDIWDRPDDYDITRSFDHDHQGFGYGEHSCPGALLARTNSVTILEHVVSRFPDWELAGPPVRWANPFIQGMAGLPLKFVP